MKTHLALATALRCSDGERASNSLPEKAIPSVDSSCEKARSNENERIYTTP
jgi:hypothetical protein